MKSVGVAFSLRVGVSDRPRGRVTGGCLGGNPPFVGGFFDWGGLLVPFFLEEASGWPRGLEGWRYMME